MAGIFAIERWDFHRFFDMTRDTSSVAISSSYKNSVYTEGLTSVKKVYLGYGLHIVLKVRYQNLLVVF